MTSKEFKKLEELTLLLDILIDCEEYDAFDDWVLRKVRDTSQKIRIDEIRDPDKAAIRENIKSITVKDLNRHADYCETILTSKYIRRLLRENKKNIISKEADALYKELTEALIKTIPEKSSQDEEKNETLTEKDVAQNKLRIIFLNEISASSQGHLAIGYAEMALSELRELNKDWLPQETNDERLRHPYELYALYNKGLTLSHDHATSDTEKAIETFFQILESFEKRGNTKLSDTFQKEYTNHGRFFNIFFWLIYVPTNYLLAEAYDGLDSSYNLEETISKVLKRIDTENVTLGNPQIPSENIMKYYKVKFTIQLLVSKIYSGDFNKNLETHKLKENWLNAFDQFFSDFERCVHYDSLDKDPKTKNDLDSAEALFWVEYAKTAKRGDSNSALNNCFHICTKHLKADGGSDWSDFAVTFLDSVIFILEAYGNKGEPWPERLKSQPEPDSQASFDKFYGTIFKKIIHKDWIPRKKDLVEKFLKCQEALLQQYEQYEKIGDRGKYLKYQFDLVKTILDDEGKRRFQKLWPQSEKEKLVKNLKQLIELFEKPSESQHDNSLSGDFEKEIKPQIKPHDESIKMPSDDDLKAVVEFIEENMNCDFYTKKLHLNTETFYDHLIYKSRRPSLKEGYQLTVLRRWQSFTPALSIGSEVGQKGGGYFIYKTDNKGEVEEGLAIDPGFNFLENFFDEGFSIRDINAILMTHSHPDHSSDFMSIMTLVHEMNKRGKRIFSDGKWTDRKLVLFMTHGCYHKFADQIKRSRDAFRDIIITKRALNYGGRNSFLDEFKLETTKANHNDQTDYDSVGYIIKDKKDHHLIGFTGDTQWFNGIEEIYKRCPILCMNIGGVVDIFKEGVLLSDLVEEKAKDNDYKKMRNIILQTSTISRTIGAITTDNHKAMHINWTNDVAINCNLIRKSKESLLFLEFMYLLW